MGAPCNQQPPLVRLAGAKLEGRSGNNEINDGQRRSELSIMKIFFICDLKSIHAQKWVGFFVSRNHQVFIYSTTPFPEDFLGARAFSLPIPVPSNGRPKSKWIPALMRLVAKWPWASAAEKVFVLRKLVMIKHETRRHAEFVMSIIRTINPDIIHALRIPNEGFIATELDINVPLVISTWGNDLIFWARRASLANLTRKTLQRTDFLLSDCQRDVRLSRKNGYAAEKPFLVIPGAGGMSDEHLQSGKNFLGARTSFLSDSFGISERPIFLNLRGFGSQDIDNVPLLKACGLLARRKLRFSMVIAGKKEGFRHYKLAHLIQKNGLGEFVRLIDELSHADALKALQSADFSISISRNDGVPNSMLEAMTFGAIPLMSDIESIREWIVDGTNGSFFDPSNPESIADAMHKAMNETALHHAIRQRNYKLVEQKGNYTVNMSEAERAFINLATRRRQGTQ